jgi:hypothetical protein
MMFRSLCPICNNRVSAATDADLVAMDRLRRPTS